MLELTLLFWVFVEQLFISPTEFHAVITPPTQCIKVAMANEGLFASQYSSV